MKMMSLSMIQMLQQKTLLATALLPELEKPVRQEMLLSIQTGFEVESKLPGWGRWGVIRQGDYKLIERFEDGRVHLFNLATDLGEKEDLAERQPDKVLTMRKDLHEWYRKVDAKFLRQKPGGPTPWQP